MKKQKEIDFFSKYEHVAYDVFAEKGYNRILREFERIVKPQKTETLVDFGCGTGSFTKRLKKYDLNLIGVDISPQCIRYARNNVKDIRFEIEDIEDIKTIPSDSADIVIFSGVLHHFADFSKTLKEAYRILKTGGRIFAYDPHKKNPAMWLYRDEKSPLHSKSGKTVNERLLTMGELRDNLKTAGFTDITVFAISGVSFNYVAGGGKFLLPVYNLFEDLFDKIVISKYVGAFVISYAKK
jgi:SAM-dependent methyltransferase